MSRRTFVSSSAAALATATASSAADRAASPQTARIAVTLDLEMSRNFPVWEATHWDYEKGNLNEQAKQYTLEVARRLREAGGVLHSFVVGQTLEQENIDWLKQLVTDGHPLGNHTYDHVNVRATQPRDIQFRFQRSPWLLRERSVTESIRDNITLCETAMQQRLNLEHSNGFRTPGGFYDGLTEFPEIRAILKECGFNWISSLYPQHPYTRPMERPTARVIDGIVDAQQRAQPFHYPDGLLEIPMSPISDIGAFRTGRWKLDWFLDTVTQCVEWAIEERAVFDFLAHPSCLYVVDPTFRAVDRICELVANAGDRAKIVSLGDVASSFTRNPN